MKYCPECGFQMKGLRKCDSCNFDVGGLFEKPQQALSGNTSGGTLINKIHKKRVSALDTQEGKAVYQKLRANKSLLKSLWLVCIVASIVLIFIFPQHFFYFAAAGIFSLNFFSRASHLRVAEYYQVPGSKSEDGEHLCIFCGGRGIYKHTIYQTYSTLADCSKCKKNLWIE